MSRHETLSNELRAAFHNPRDIGYLYLEAKFSKSGISSLKEVLHEFSDLKASLLTIVPEMELKRCLTIMSSDTPQVFAPGEWVLIKWGLYRRDVGLVLDDYCDDESMSGVKVLVVPRLKSNTKDDPSTSNEHKCQLPSRPPPLLFKPASYDQDQLIQHKRGHVFTFKSWRFMFGLQVKTFSRISLCSARDIPLSIYHLFMDAKALAGPAGDIIDISSMPLPLFWMFEPGELVIVHSNTGSLKRSRTVVSFSTLNNNSVCEVDLGDGGHKMVLAKNMEKDIILGQYVEVLAGVHLGQKGFVVAKINALLGICVGLQTNGVNFHVHVNSVKLALPEYLNTKIPWLNVQVWVVNRPYINWTGFVKHVAVTSGCSLAITVCSPDGQERVLGYQAVREICSGSLLMDYQPLRPHQRQFDVEVPWKEIETFEGHSVSHCGSRAAGAQLTSTIPQTQAPLLTYRPLEGNQLKEFSISSSIEGMCTGPLPWLGFLVDFVKGKYKGEYSLVKDVNHYQVNPALNGKWSGLTLTVEQYTFTTNPSSKLVKADYDALRFHNLLAIFVTALHVTETLVFAIALHVSRRLAYSRIVFASIPRTERSKGVANSFTESYPSPAPWPWTPASPLPSRAPSPSPPLPSRAPSPAPPPPDHWVLNPKLLGIMIKVDIRGGTMDTLKKKDGIFVETIADKDGINIVYQPSASKIIPIHFDSVISFRSRPKPAIEKGLMVVARNYPKHIGKLVCQIHHFYEEEKTEGNHCLMLMTTNCTGPKETTDERRWSTELFCEIRMDFTYSSVDVRPSANP
ncbi:hypothetical protein GGU10DRAFT_372413 [Lentinula aff. detonsa]|uniref:Chromatin elongation factor spt5 n=1 Tax=Lentinula aff. detonsa TaxID=2804958 RepID=A0AA38NQF2_9AGAR|nr:hypothetical protein GGU10DRAFT_372413 [Lentinula aff. detonsa]